MTTRILREPTPRERGPRDATAESAIEVCRQDALLELIGTVNTARNQVEARQQGVFTAARDGTGRKRAELALQETNVELETASKKEVIAQIPQPDRHLLELINEVLDLAREPSSAPLRTLLYVEDNPANLALVEQLIARRSDIRLMTAVNGALGVEVARASQPEVILMDINLPVISGIEALKILRQDPATAHIPIVALSANAMPRDIQKGLEAGFFRYLTKPIKVHEFMATLDVALESAAAGA